MATFSERFWAKVDRSGGLEACWPWTGAHKKAGYGHIFRDGRFVGAHRVSLEISLGRPLAEGSYACHTCDNPPCCNPAHLFEGTPRDNMLDASGKGHNARQRHPETTARGIWHGSVLHPERVPHGEAHGQAKLSEALVRWIRLEHATGRSAASIARELQVASSTIDRVLNGKHWRDVPAKAEVA